MWFTENGRGVFPVYREEYLEKYHEVYKETCMLRAESIRAQLDGKLSTKTSEQVKSDKIDASHIKISDMGSNDMQK